MQERAVRPLTAPPTERRLAPVDDTCLVDLDQDHPGFRDDDYRRRRNDIALVARNYQGGPVPEVEYSDREHDVWREVWDLLGPLHERHACREYLDAAARMNLDRTRIPQLWEVNRSMMAETGFEMQPIAGMVNARTFLSRLGARVFPSTQYIRHHSVPLYTPEPDVVHELVGHAATLIQPDIARIAELIGQAAQVATDDEIVELERIYWYIFEYGVVEQDGELKAVGAGILSSAGELERFADGPFQPWSSASMAATPYDPTDYQPFYYVAPSFERMIDDVTGYITERFG